MGMNGVPAMQLGAPSFEKCHGLKTSTRGQVTVSEHHVFTYVLQCFTYRLVLCS